MTLKEFLKEEFEDAFKNDKGEYIEVFKNPNSKEMKQLTWGNEVKFIADRRTKILYAFSPEKTIHDEVINNMGRNFLQAPLLLVTAKEIGNKYTIVSANRSSDFKTKLSDWNWLKKYFFSISDSNMLKNIFPIQ